MIYDNEILPQIQYTIYRHDCGSRGGGVMLGIKQDILSKVLPSPPGLEILTIQIVSYQETLFSLPASQFINIRD